MAFLSFFIKVFSGINVRGVEIRNAAKRFANRLRIEHFEASNGWLRSRHGLTNHITHGEAASAPTEEIQPFKDTLKKLMKDESLKRFQVYNADETGLFWRSLPKNTQAYEHEKNYRDVKIAKTDCQRYFVPMLTDHVV